MPDWQPVDQNTLESDWPDRTQDMIDLLASNFASTTNPRTGYTTSPGVNGTIWMDENDAGGGVYYARIINRAGTGENIMGRRDEDYMGLIDRYGNNAMAADLDLGGFVPKGVASGASSGAPSWSSGDKWFKVKDTGGITYYLWGLQDEF